MSIIYRALRWPVTDYRAWVALGEGGIDHGIRGWLTVTALRAVAWAGRLAPALPNNSPVRSSVLHDLPPRPGTKPRIAPHPVPQRQLGGDCTPAMLRRLDEIILSHHEAHKPLITLELSRYEKHVQGLYVPSARQRGVSKTGEMVHVHHPQGSLHVQLSEADAWAVYERGWGEPHGLAFLGVAVPRAWFFIYAPRDEDELRVVAAIVAASLRWAIGGEEEISRADQARDEQSRSHTIAVDEQK